MLEWRVQAKGKAMKPTVKEFIISSILGLSCATIIIWAFWSRENGGGKPIVQEPSKAKVYSDKGDVLTVSKIVFTDDKGNETLKINAGPPATLEIRDSRGRVKVLDLPSLASKLSIWGEGE